MADRTFKLTFLGDASSAVRALGGLETKLSGTQKVAAGVATSDMLQGLGSNFTAKIVGSKDAASALNEQMSKARVVFGESFKAIDTFADKNARAFNLSKREAYQYGSQLGLILKAGGATDEQAAEMSLTLLKLAADTSSFFDIPLDEALQKVQSGLVGESEPLRPLGVLIDEATTAHKGLEMGLADSAKELTVQDKVLARYTLILEGLAVANGDVGRTADSTANQQRKATKIAEDNAAVMGGPISSTWGAILQLWNSAPASAQLAINAFLLVAGGLVVFLALLPSITAGAGIVATAIGGISLAFLAIPLAIAAVVLAVIGLFVYWDQIVEKARGVREAILSTVGLTGEGQATKSARAGLSGVGQGIVSGIPLLGAIQALKGDLPGFAAGGIVGGPRGAPQLAIVHGGERIIPNGGAAATVVVNVHGAVLGTSAEVGRYIVEALTTQQQRGSLGLT